PHGPRRDEVHAGHAPGAGRAQDPAAPERPLHARIHPGEAVSRPATRLASAVLGIALFVASFAVFRLFENPPEGAGALALEVAGWLGMFIAGRIITGGSVGPSLVVLGWLRSFRRNARGGGARRPHVRRSSHSALASWLRPSARTATYVEPAVEGAALPQMGPFQPPAKASASL